MNYFIHDSNARSDERILKVRMHHNAAGYGVYFMLLELLRDSTNYMCVRDYNAIAYELRVDSKLVKEIIENYGLFTFTEDGKCFYSESFSERMRKFDKAHKRRVDAGRKGGRSRWEKESPSSVIQQDEYFADIRISDTRNAKSFIRKFSITHKQLVEKLDAFLLDCQCRGSSFHNGKRDALSHFTDWLRINLETETITSNETRTENITASKRRGVEASLNSASDYEGAF